MLKVEGVKGACVRAGKNVCEGVGCNIGKGKGR